MSASDACGCARALSSATRSCPPVCDSGAFESLLSQAEHIPPYYCFTPVVHRTSCGALLVQIPVGSRSCVLYHMYYVGTTYSTYS